MSSIKLDWVQSGLVDGFDIYRSLSPMSTSAMPEPIASTVDKFYFDLSITTGVIYYYRVGSKRGEDTMYSAEVEILADTLPVSDPHFLNVQLLLNSETTIVDKSRFKRALQPIPVGISIQPATLPINSANAISFDGNSQGGVISTGNINIGYSDFTYEAFVVFGSKVGISHAILLTLSSIILKLSATSIGTWQLYLGGGGSVDFSADVKYDVKTHVCLLRKNNILYVLFDGVVKCSANVSIYDISSVAAIGGARWESGAGFKMQIDSVRYTSVARYSETGFIPIYEPFPTQ